MTVTRADVKAIRAFTGATPHALMPRWRRILLRFLGLCLAVLTLAACNSQSDQQERINHDTNGHSGSWQCIEHYGDQSNC